VLLIHCSACFRDGCNTRALHLSRSQGCRLRTARHSCPILSISSPAVMRILYNKSSRIHHERYSQLYPLHSCVGNLYRFCIHHAHIHIIPSCSCGCLLVCAAWRFACSPTSLVLFFQEITSRRYKKNYTTTSPL